MAIERHRKRDGGIQMRTTDPRDRKNRHKNRHRPTRRDNDPSRVLAFAFIEKNIRHDAIAEKDQKRCSEEFGKGG
jgi:hypothetical protein